MKAFSTDFYSQKIYYYLFAETKSEMFNYYLKIVPTVYMRGVITGSPYTRINSQSRGTGKIFQIGSEECQEYSSATNCRRWWWNMPRSTSQ